jgi:hypothetical protein
MRIRAFLFMDWEAKDPFPLVLNEQGVLLQIRIYGRNPRTNLSRLV